METQLVLVLYVILLVVLNSFGFQQSILDTAVLPSWYPPRYLFGLVWTILFILFGVFLTTTDSAHQWFGLGLYAVTLCWPLVFNYSSSFAVGFYYLFFIWILTVLYFIYTLSPLLVPQLSWVTFATALSYSLYQLNE